MLFNMPSSFGLVSLPYLFVFYPPKCKLALVPTMRPILNELEFLRTMGAALRNIPQQLVLFTISTRRLISTLGYENMVEVMHDKTSNIVGF